jgi:hypothetical protein
MVQFAVWGWMGKSALTMAQPNPSLKEILPLLKTKSVGTDVEKQLLAKGFVVKGVSKGKEQTLQGLVDSGQVVITLRKTSKKGPIWGYQLTFQEGSGDWNKKKSSFEGYMRQINLAFEQSPSNTTLILPQYCLSKEAQCFKDGVAKFQSSWYWNDAVQRIKTLELKINANYETVLVITDNSLENE